MISQSWKAGLHGYRGRMQAKSREACGTFTSLIRVWLLIHQWAHLLVVSRQQHLPQV